MKKKDLYAIVLGALSLLVGVRSAQAIDIPGDDLYYDADGTTYTLNQNILETIYVVSDGITLDGGGFEVSGASPDPGVSLGNREDVTIRNLKITGCGAAIQIVSSENITVTGNTLENNSYGIFLSDSSRNEVIDNTASSCGSAGIWLQTGSNGNDLIKNAISGSWYGIYVQGSRDNAATENTVSSLDFAVKLWNSSDNDVYNNNFMNVEKQLSVGGSSADNAFYLAAAGGNYWLDYTGTDDGSDGRIADDGIGDTDLPHQGVDNYPFMTENGWVTPANQAPVAMCQDVTVSADEYCQADVAPEQVDNGSDDPDGDPITLSLNPAGPYELGDTPVTLIVSDGTETATCSATVTVIDDTPPEITCPEDFTVYTNPGEWDALVEFEAVATDNCGEVEVICWFPSGTRFPVGETTVDCYATDAALNNADCSFTVTVVKHYEPAKSLKYDAIDALNTLAQEIGNKKKIAKGLNDAIKHIEHSLGGDLWVDEAHIDARHGKKVFDEEKKAIRKLMRLIKKEHTQQDVVDVCNDVIGMLVEADKRLADAAFDDASAALAEISESSPKAAERIERELDKCRKESEKADEELDKEHPDHAIDHYKKAWEHAQHALDQVPDPEDKGKGKGGGHKKK